MAGSEKVSTVYLGQYTEAHAEAIVKALEDAGITWWQKGAGRVAKILFAGDWGVRLFVDEKRIDEARAIAKEHGGTS
jgi:Putative prokaryotic signal transducing protein